MMATGIQSNKETTAAAEALAAYHQGLVDLWSEPRYEYDQRFVRLTLMVDKGPEGVAPDRTREPYTSLRKLLEEIDELAAVLIGHPGSGKTTLLGQRQLEHAQAELAAPTGQISFFAQLNQYRGEEEDDPPPEPAVWLAREWEDFYPDLPRFDTLFRQGRLLLLLDGLNEMPHQSAKDYGRRIGRWQSFVRRATHFRNTVVFSCREENYFPTLSNRVVTVRRIDVQPLSHPQIAEFLDRYLQEVGPEVGAAVYAELAADPRQLDLYSNAFFLHLLVSWVANRGGGLPKGQAELLTGFVRQALWRELDAPGSPLFSNEQLFNRDDCKQIKDDDWNTPYDLPAEGLLIPQLERLAFRMQDGRQRGENAQVSLPQQRAREWLEPALAEAVLAAGIQLNVLDKDLTKREIKFSHQLIQEYFAARELARTSEPWRVEVAWDARPTSERRVSPALEEVRATWPKGESLLKSLAATGWEETTVLAAAMTADRKTFVDLLTFFNLPLAGRCAAAAEVRPYLSAVFIERLQEELQERIGDAGADLRARIAAAEALGELGDPRFERRSGPHGDYLLPRTLASIPGGTYIIGADEGQYDDEKPAHPVPVVAFEMGVFPVTNAEYRLFMEAGGYKEERWWETEAARAWLRGERSNESMKAEYKDLAETLRRDWSDQALREHPTFTPDQVETYLWLKGAEADELERQVDKWYPPGVVQDKPAYWEDSRFNHPTRPVVGISWYEARAYCAWLSAQTGEKISLPTEVEWEAAARGSLVGDNVGAGLVPAQEGDHKEGDPCGRPYAYGYEYDAAKCNTFETHIRATTPVGVFPEGKTTEDVYDLSGNVWEWTSTIFRDYPYKAEDGREAPDDALARRVLRGGSWSYGQLFARAVYRADDHPDDRSGFVGRRVVRRRRPPSQNDH